MPPPAPTVGRFTGIILGFVVFVCVAMIGGAGYLKYQLDRAETVLAAPDTALGSDQDLFDRLRRDLGYGGFLGLAQNYALTHDASGFAEMKARIKSADDIVTHLPDKTPAETRHEVAAIVALFDGVLQKINAPAGDPGSEFSAADLAPLYAALPILDSRVTAGAAEARLAAQTRMQFWAMLLTLACWCSLIIASACAAGIYLTLRDKHSAPMRALAQSIQNMARGDMRTAIWGTERQDVIGELARAVDIARYHFSHLPDLSLISEQGPVRMRFEGGTRSLFEAMMQAISRDSEHIRTHSSSLIDLADRQKISIAELSEKIEAIMKNILQRGQTGDREIGQAIQEMLGSAERLKNAHAHAADQLNRLIPSLEDRANGLAEIAHITGKQVGQTLQSLSASEAGIKANAEQGKETLAKLSATADELGTRMFGAINLLQAGGKVLAETTEDIKGKITDALNNPTQAQAWPATDLAPLSQRLEQIAAQLAGMQAQMAEQHTAQADIIAALERQPTAAPAVASVVQDSEIFAPTNEKLAQVIDQMSAILAVLSSPAPPPATAPDMHQELQALTAHIDSAQRQFVDIIADRNVVENTALATLNEKIDALRAEMEKPAPPAPLSPDALRQMQAQGQQIAAQIDATRGHIERALQQTVQQNIAAKLDGFEQTLSATRDAVEIGLAAANRPAPQTYTLPPELQQQMLDHWFQMAAQLEASRASMIETITDQIDRLETRLAGRSAGTLSKTAADYATQRQIEQQTQILSELVATLGTLDAHMQQMKAEMRAGG